MNYGLIAFVLISSCICTVYCYSECLNEFCDHTPIDIKSDVSSPIQDNL